MHRAIAVVLALRILVALTPNAHATFIDLRGLNIGNPTSAKITVDGITLDLSGSKLSSTPTRFGIDGAGDSDAPDLLDGGNGVPETLAFLFSPVGAVLDSIVISSFDGDDAGLIDFKGLGEFSITDGVNSLPGIEHLATSAHYIRWSGSNTPGATRGFSVDGFNFHLVPEPASLALLTCAMLLVMPCLARRRGK